MSETRTRPFQVVRNAGGLTDAKGFACAAVASGIRGTQSDRLDLGLVYSERPCKAAAVFTTNAIVAAPVTVSRERLAEGRSFHGIVFNSGNANACTGAQGRSDAETMLWAAESAVGAPSGSFLVCSTGRIGRDLPMKRVLGGIRTAGNSLAENRQSGLDAADSILTSDTRRKTVTVRLKTPEGISTLSGIAKGAGMIQPNMATMLAFIVTDAAVSASILQRLLKASVGPSFNTITVDGDTSTNDTVIALANGASGVRISGEATGAFALAFQYVCTELARMIVGDGEKITKVVELLVTGARSHAEADMVARSIGNSLLVKSSWFGNDPNWGRVIDAAGYSGARMSEGKLRMTYGVPGKDTAVAVFEEGRGVEKNAAQWKRIVARREFTIGLDLGLGSGTARLLASDLTDGYVHYNKSE